MARPKLGDTETQRLQLKITEEEISAIDDWRFSNRVPSRSEAVRRLVQIGARAHKQLEGIETATKKAQRQASSFAVRWHELSAASSDTTDRLKFANEVLLLAANEFLKASSEISEAYIAVLDLQLELSQFTNRDDVTSAISSAEAIRNDAIEYSKKAAEQAQSIISERNVKKESEQ
ncbi:hypothetical protein [Aureimonas psammosilenae]|uniref:hypothetical protein n=1 Tax=Aureimonas psammosilenae TaxID=2495496 RepID=UPI0012612A36|nr:hypothetical protein [Aureimonas psammosilenae]